MKPYFLLIAVLLVAAATSIEAGKKRRKSSSYSPANKSKTKTKWSTSTENGPSGSVVASEEHGYYIKRTYMPLNGSALRQSPPYLAIPIAWFSCSEGKSPADCHQSNSAAINGQGNALSNDGFLCDDDCLEPYEPICGKTNSEVAVFYNKCKLTVAKCRTHGLWQDLDYSECQKAYPKETDYADKKFKSSPFFKEMEKEESNKKKKPMLLENEEKPQTKPVEEEEVTSKQPENTPVLKDQKEVKDIKETGEAFNEIEKKGSIPTEQVEATKVLSLIS